MKPLILCLLFWLPTAAVANDLPNILWITSEDNGPQLGCYGDDYAVSPNLDALAKKGMIYLHASSNAPVCAPARTAIISGLYPPATGAEHMRSQTSLPAGFLMYPQYLRQAGYYCTNNSKEDYNLQKNGQVWDESSRNAHWKNRKPDQPFFAIFNHTISHESQIRNAIPRENQIHDPAHAPVPAYHPDTPSVRKNWAQYYDRITMMDQRVAENLKEIEAAGLADDTIVFYYGDHGSGMPRSKRWPYNSGLHVPLIVHFPDKWKHLAPADYEAGGSSDRLVSFVDLAPTLLSIAGIQPPDWMQGHAFAGKYPAPAPEFSYGFRGRMDERYDLVRTVRSQRYVYIRHYMPHKPYGQYINYMFITPATRDWFELYQAGKLNAAQARFWQPKPAEELYDLQTDPDEVHNLVDSSEHAAILQRMRTAHQNWVRKIRDVGFLSEWEMHERSQGSTPYEMGHDPDQYDLETILAAADLATSGTAERIPEIVALLDHDDPAVRYWATIGLLVHERTGYQKAREKLLAALDDPSPIVQIHAAESLGRYGTDDEAQQAVEILLKHAAPDANVYLGIAAWNAIDYLDRRAMIAADQIRALSPEPTRPRPRVSEYSARVKEKVVADLASFEQQDQRNP